MTREQFKDLITSRKGAALITIWTITDPTWESEKKTGPNPHKGKVRKRSVVNGMINWRYERAVNRQREREGKEADFEALPRAWGTRIPGTPFVTHEGKEYLEVKIERVLSVDYIDQSGDVVEGARHYVKPPKEQLRQELEKAIVLRDYALTNIVGITFQGNTYTIEAGQ